MEKYKFQENLQTFHNFVPLEPPLLLPSVFHPPSMIESWMLSFTMIQNGERFFKELRWVLLQR